MGREDARSVYKVFHACLAEEIPIRVRHRLAFGGALRDFETTVTPICDPDTGRIAKLLGSHRDLSKDPFESHAERAPGVNGNVNVRLASLQEDIQQRIASDLHDSTCQHLIAASLSVMRVRSALGDPAGAERLCDDIDTSIDQALKEIRTYVYLLHPHNLMVDGLKATIERYAHGFAARTALRVVSEISPEADRLPYETQRSLLRVVQEALTNVFRHAKATAVEIVGKATNSHFELRIADNGRGMPNSHATCSPTRAISPGVGILAMKARLHQIGGKLEIRSEPGQQLPGTTVCAIVPYVVAKDEDATGENIATTAELAWGLK
jgi:signal transduction histidine kinase